jgi:hypothetical protein
MQIVRIGDGSATYSSAETIGAKAANLARMAALGLPVPPAFVLPVRLCAAIAKGDPHAERHLIDGLKEGIRFLEGATGKGFGDRRRPLLVSVRSGAARSMPGMLDTVLDIGCTQAAVRGLVRMTGNPRFAWDCRRRLLEGYAEIVLGLDPALLTARLAQVVAREGVANDRELDTDAVERLLRTTRRCSTIMTTACQMIRWTRSPAPRVRCFVRGPAIGRAAIGSCRTSSICAAPPSPSRPWCSGTADCRRVPASHSRVIPPPGPGNRSST